MASPIPTMSPDFLSSSRPGITVQKVDFRKTSLPENDGLHAYILDNVLSINECESLVRGAEGSTEKGWEPAMVNVGCGRQELMPMVRDCGRIIWDDQAVATKVWMRVKHLLPDIEFLSEVPRITGWGPFKRNETWRLSRPNERMRFLKYGAGQYFKPHMDGVFVTPDETEMSFFTLHLYLNESDPNSPEGKLQGGATTFHSENMEERFDVEPKLGRVLIFQHKGLLHSGEDVEGGIKLTLRTDLMYKKVGKELL